jgi:hypothetical protein
MSCHKIVYLTPQICERKQKKMNGRYLVIWFLNNQIKNVLVVDAIDEEAAFMKAINLVDPMQGGREDLKIFDLFDLRGGWEFLPTNGVKK